MTPQQQTSKKQKFVGIKTLVDPETGEKYPMQINQIEDRDFDFTKVWMKNLIYSLEPLGTQKIKVAFWIMDQLDKENQLIMTQRQIAEKSGVSLKTVSTTIKMLCAGDMPLLQRINGGGAYRVNPAVMYKGSHQTRMGIAFQFMTTEAENKKNTPADDQGSVDND